MLKSCRSHEKYQGFLKQHIPALYHADPNRLVSFSKHLSALWLLDLDPAIPYFIEHYSACGRPAVFDPIDLFRSLVLMTKTRNHFGITEWSQALRNDRVLATLSGFFPDKTPSVGAFYTFLDRFWLTFNPDSKKRRLKLLTARRKPRQNKGSKPKKGEVTGKVEKPVEVKKTAVPEEIKVASPHHKRSDEDVVDHQDEREKRKEESIFDDSVKLYLQQLSSMLNQPQTNLFDLRYKYDLP